MLKKVKFLLVQKSTWTNMISIWMVDLFEISRHGLKDQERLMMGKIF